jgi:hypothetical protein
MPTVSSAHVFNANELLTLVIAAYAAVVSTFVLGWDAYKWLVAGARVDLSASTGMKVVGGQFPDQNTYVTVTALNVGDRPTTITNLGGMYFNSWWRAYITRRTPASAFIITEPSQGQRIPYRFEVGAQWIGMVHQTDDIVQMAQDGYLFLILYTATNGRGQRVRINIRNKEDGNDGEHAST